MHFQGRMWDQSSSLELPHACVKVEVEYQFARVYAVVGINTVRTMHDVLNVIQTNRQFLDLSLLVKLH
jgi:hypothetical protein